MPVFFRAVVSHSPLSTKVQPKSGSSGPQILRSQPLEWTTLVYARGSQDRVLDLMALRWPDGATLQHNSCLRGCLQLPDIILPLGGQPSVLLRTTRAAGAQCQAAPLESSKAVRVGIQHASQTADSNIA